MVDITNLNVPQRICFILDEHDIRTVEELTQRCRLCNISELDSFDIGLAKPGPGQGLKCLKCQK